MALSQRAFAQYDLNDAMPTPSKTMMLSGTDGWVNVDMTRVAINVAIAVLNAVAGWTVIGWIVVLVVFALLH